LIFKSVETFEMSKFNYKTAVDKFDISVIKSNVECTPEQFTHWWYSRLRTINRFYVILSFITEFDGAPIKLGKLNRWFRRDRFWKFIIIDKYIIYRGYTITSDLVLIDRLPYAVYGEFNLMRKEKYSFTNAYYLLLDYDVPAKLKLVLPLKIGYKELFELLRYSFTRSELFWITINLTKIISALYNRVSEKTLIQEIATHIPESVNDSAFYYVRQTGNYSKMFSTPKIVMDNYNIYYNDKHSTGESYVYNGHITILCITGNIKKIYRVSSISSIVYESYLHDSLDCPFHKYTQYLTYGISKMNSKLSVIGLPAELTSIISAYAYTLQN
jgi:hypothetical protein